MELSRGTKIKSQNGSEMFVLIFFGGALRKRGAKSIALLRCGDSKFHLKIYCP